MKKKIWKKGESKNTVEINSKKHRIIGENLLRDKLIEIIIPNILIT